jgi:hypothetical protein
MLRNKKGFGSLTLYGALGVAAVIAVMGIVILIQSYKIKALDADNKRLEAENARLIIDNNGFHDILIKEQRACEGAIKKYTQMLDECTSKASKCTVVDITGCPEIKTTTDPKQDPELGKLQGIWRRQP